MNERKLRRRRVLALSGSALAGGSLAGCIEGPWTGDPEDPGTEPDIDPDPPDHTPGEPEERAQVLMETRGGESHYFSPLLVHVEEGGTVEWVLGNGMHNTVAYHPNTDDDVVADEPMRIPEDAEPWASPTLDETDVEEDADEPATWQHTFETEGVYDYVCTPHERWGMVGSVIVGWPDPDDQPGLEEPADDFDDDAASTLENINQQTLNVLEDDNDEDAG